MTIPRKLVVSGGTGIYHCISRCVRRAYLYGFDSVSGNNYDHRKEWIRDRLKLLTQVFTIDVLQYALMDNHAHTMLRLRADLLASLSNEEVVRRWLMLYPKKGVSDDLESEEAKSYLQMLLLDEKRVALLRERLCSISWFMKSLNEYIARMANKEDQCKGRFWEGRFKCTKLEGQAAVLCCAIYIDLNPIRAGKASTPEASEFTSAHERIHTLKPSRLEEPELWIAPLKDIGNRQGFLPVSLQDYITILDTTGRELRKGKRGAIPSKLEPILVRLGVRPRGWLSSVEAFGRGYAHFAGNEESLKKRARMCSKRWVKGLSLARSAFV